MEKKKILIISDHPLSPSGVGTQSRYFIEAMLKTGRYKVECLGGAMQHPDYRPTKIEPWGDDWVVHPVNGYGDPPQVRSMIANENPDLLWFMTDPRFYGWLWEIENEIRPHIPMVYYHVWDNFPAPMFNGKYYRSTDKVVCISKVTRDILEQVSPDVDSCYLPHAVDSEIFRHFKKTDTIYAKVKTLEKQILEKVNPAYRNKHKKYFFWNNRNARRKQSGTLIWWFKEWLDKVGHDKATLIMHTDPRDPHGQDLPHLIKHLNVDGGQVILSTGKIPAIDLATFYNFVDFTINISDAEGFGLSTLESMACGTPVIVNMTGGLQEQVTDGENWFGYGIEPASKSVIGSLQVPYIYEDRISQKDFNATMTKALNVSPKAYKKMSIQAREHVRKNYNFDNYQKRWVEIIDEVLEKNGSWDTRTGYKPWHLLEVK